MTYKGWRGVTRPKLDLTEEHLTGLLSKIVANYLTQEKFISQRLTKQQQFDCWLASWHLQSLFIIVSPLVDRMKN